jgi:hypothetical protein
MNRVPRMALNSALERITEDLRHMEQNRDTLTAVQNQPADRMAHRASEALVLQLHDVDAEMKRLNTLG